MKAPAERIARFLLLLLLALWLVLGSLISCHQQEKLDQVKAPDTVYVDKPYPVYVKVPEYRESPPRVVTVYRVPDSLRRQKMERDTLVGGLRYRTGSLEVERITPKGISLVSNYGKLPDFVTIEMDAKGRVTVLEDPKAKRKAKVKKILGIGWDVIKIGGAFFIGTRLAN